MREGCFVWGVYLRDYPNPYLYTRTGPIGDIVSTARAAKNRAPVPPTILLFLLLLFLCLLVVCGGRVRVLLQIAAASTIPIMVI